MLIQLKYIPWAGVEAFEPDAAALAAYMLASSWAFDIFFLYLIRLLPNQLAICNETQNYMIKFIHSQKLKSMYTIILSWGYHSTNLANSDVTFSSQLFLGFLTGIWVAKMRVKVLVQHLGCLLAKIPSLSPATENISFYTHIVISHNSRKNFII